MKSFILLLSWLCLIQPRLIAQPNIEEAIIDSINNTFTYTTGLVTIANGSAGLHVPKEFKYLNPEQSRRVLVDLWGNTQDVATQGMLFLVESGPVAPGAWAFNINYDEMGYVEDKAADDIDYDSLLKQMQENTDAENEDRAKNGHQDVRLIGWASPPFYDETNKVLHWAKEFRFGDSASVNTLNYDVRLLGRRGVMSLNAIASMNELPTIKQHIPAVINSVTFRTGNRYVDFNPKIDQVAAVGIGGLVAGKMLAKVGAFALLAKFWKVLLLVAAGGVAAIRQLFGRQTPEKELA